MGQDGRFVVTEADRRARRRQAEALAAEPGSDEGTAAWRSRMREGENERRAAAGLPPQGGWWEEKTEPELHARARALGLLERIR